MVGQTANVEKGTITPDCRQLRKESGIVPLYEALEILKWLLINHARPHAQGRVTWVTDLLGMPRATYYRWTKQETKPHVVFPERNAAHLMANFVRQYLALAAGMSIHSFDLNAVATLLNLEDREVEALKPLLEL
jgi:hypothetical protein